MFNVCETLPFYTPHGRPTLLETKALIIHEILKRKDAPFKARQIYDEIGVSAQNVSNHLSRMVDKGVLMKQGTFFVVPSQERLVDELAAAHERVSIEKASDTKLTRNLEDVQNWVDQVVRARVLGKPNATELYLALNSEIDDTLAEFKKLKKWLNKKSYTLSRAEKGYDETIYGALTSLFRLGEE